MTALCSPTRVALKSGRNHHTANAGSIMETATAFPGNTGQIPNSVAPLAEMLYQLIYDGVIKVDHPKMKDYQAQEPTLRRPRVPVGHEQPSPGVARSDAGDSSGCSSIHGSIRCLRSGNSSRPIRIASSPASGAST